MSQTAEMYKGWFDNIQEQIAQQAITQAEATR